MAQFHSQPLCVDSAEFLALQPVLLTIVNCSTYQQILNVKQNVIFVVFPLVCQCVFTHRNSSLTIVCVNMCYYGVTFYCKSPCDFNCFAIVLSNTNGQLSLSFAVGRVW